MSNRDSVPNRLNTTSGPVALKPRTNSFHTNNNNNPNYPINNNHSSHSHQSPLHLQQQPANSVHSVSQSPRTRLHPRSPLNVNRTQHMQQIPNNYNNNNMMNPNMTMPIINGPPGHPSNYQHQQQQIPSNLSSPRGSINNSHHPQNNQFQPQQLPQNNNQNNRYNTRSQQHHQPPLSMQYSPSPRPRPQPQQNQQPMHQHRAPLVAAPPPFSPILSPSHHHRQNINANNQQNIINIPTNDISSNLPIISPSRSTSIPFPMTTHTQNHQTAKISKSASKTVTKSAPKKKANTKTKTRSKAAPKSNSNSNSKSKPKSKPKSKSKPKTKAKPPKKLSRAQQIEAYTDRVKGYWIGQRIIVETENGTKLKARIKDYYSDTQQVQIWFDNADSTFETRKLENWVFKVPDTMKINEYLNVGKLTRGKYKIIDYIPDGKDYKFKPMKIELLQRVSVLYRDDNEYTAFIDGYDPISRRHHINYGDTSEWCWLHKDRVKPIKYAILKHAEEKRREIALSKKFAIPPPWDPEPYGMDKNWAQWSKRLDSDDVSSESSSDDDDVKRELRPSKPTKRKKAPTAVVAVVTRNNVNNSNSNTNSSKKNTVSVSAGKKRKNGRRDDNFGPMTSDDDDEEMMDNNSTAISYKKDTNNEMLRNLLKEKQRLISSQKAKIAKAKKLEDENRAIKLQLRKLREAHKSLEEKHVLSTTTTNYQRDEMNRLQQENKKLLQQKESMKKELTDERNRVIKENVILKSQKEDQSHQIRELQKKIRKLTSPKPVSNNDFLKILFSV